MLLSPGVDCTFASESFVDNQDRDALLRLSNLLVLRSHYVTSARLYTHPEVSPLFADFGGFPPLFLQAGTTEMLRDEAVRTADKAQAAGVDVELELWPETPQVCQLAPFRHQAEDDALAPTSWTGLPSGAAGGSGNWRFGLVFRLCALALPLCITLEPAKVNEIIRRLRDRRFRDRHFLEAHFAGDVPRLDWFVRCGHGSLLAAQPSYSSACRTRRATGEAQAMAVSSS